MSNVPEGYKQTEVGVIPEDWIVIPIFELSGFKRELFNDGDWIESEHIVQSGIRLVQTGNIGIGKFLDASKKYIGQSSFDRLKCKSLIVGDILISRLADPAGRSCLYEGVDELAITSVDVTIFRPLIHLADRRFLVNIFSTRRWLTQVAERSGGTTHKRISRSSLAKIKIGLPPLPEQRAIASALADMDALLDSLEELLTKKRQLKQAAMQELLTGKTRLEGFEGEWEEKTIAELCAQIIDYRGRTPLKMGMEWGNGDIAALSAGNVKMGYIDFDAECYLGSEKLYKRWMTAGELEKGDIIFTTEAPLGNVALIPDNKKYILSQRVIALKIRRLVFDNAFLLQKILSTEFQELLTNNSSGSTAQGIKRKVFEKLTVFIPCLAEQRAIAAILSEMDAELEALQERLSKTRDLKQGMMQELMTGRTRLI